MVNPQAKTEVRTFTYYDTGHPIEQPERLEFIGTVQVDSLVWHFFEVKR